MPRRPSRLPEFVIIGAAKAATTWLAHQLRQHPSIFMPGPEPHYFSTQFYRGPGWYGNQFRDARPDEMIGEKSADYLAHADAPHRIARVLPKVPLIVQLRNPVERAYSDYCMLYRRGAVGGDPRKYLAHGSEATRFLADGFYGVHLGRYLDHFPREQIKVFLHEDIISAPEETIVGACRHIGVDAHLSPIDVGSRKNDSETPMLPLALRRLLHPAKHLVQPLRTKGWFRWAHAQLARPVRYPPLTDDLRSRLCDYYRNDVEQLGRMIDRDLSSWLSVRTAPREVPVSA